MTLKPSQLLYETFILNGGSKNIINNINYFNKEIQNQQTFGFPNLSL
jgi:hypothetical protein